MSTSRSRRRSRRLRAALVAFGAVAALTVVAGPATALRPGDAGRFDTWTGYDVGRFPVAAAPADFNGDGAIDVAWGRSDFFTVDVPNNSLAVQTNFGDGTLREPVQYPTTNETTDIAAGDIDEDGDADIVAIAEGTCLCNQQIDLFINDGTGTFTRSTATGGEGPRRLVLTDLNGDGSPDIALANYWANPGTISVLLNNGNGTFASEDVYPAGDDVGGIATTDLDQDGDVDLAASWGDDNDIVVRAYLNGGNGSFSPSESERISGGGLGAPVVAGADLDEDGLGDLVVGGIGTDAHIVMLNQGGLEFTIAPYSGGFSSSNLRPVDYDADGDVDVLSATPGSFGGGEVTLLRNAGDGTFAVEVLESSHQPYDVEAADIDGDGLLDLVVANGGTASIHPQATAGNFEVPSAFATFAPAFNLTTADFDLDGDADVATSLFGPFGDDGIQVMLNDGVGNLTAGEAIEPGGSNPQSIRAAQLNGDNAADLVWVLDATPYPFVYALNNGDGTFAAPVVEVVEGCDTGEVTVADTDNDGDNDVLLAINSLAESCFGVSDGVTVVENNGNGTFGAHFHVEMEYFPQMAQGGDLNGDGITDIVSVGTGQGDERDVSVRLGTGGGSFAPAQHFSVGAAHREMALADLDADGDLDVATADYDDHVSVLLNDGSGSFGTIRRYIGEVMSGLFNQFAIDVGDLNADGAVDLVVANFSGNDLGVHYGRGDGTFDTTQVRYGMRTAPRDVELVDLDRDGLLDAATSNFIEGGNPSAASADRRPPQRRGDSARARVAAEVEPQQVDDVEGVSVLLNETPISTRCTVRGTIGPDVLIGTDGRDVLCGLGGNDRIEGMGGDDLLIGGPGQDAIIGGDGRDALHGGAAADRLHSRDGVKGNDKILGGTGTDECRTDRRDVVVSCP